MEVKNSRPMEKGWDTVFKFFLNGDCLDGYLFTLIRNQVNDTPCITIAPVKNRKAGEAICFRRWDVYQLKNALYDEKWVNGEVAVIDDTNRKITIKSRVRKSAISIKLTNKTDNYRLELPTKQVNAFRSTLHSINLILGAKRLFDSEDDLRHQALILLMNELVRKELRQMGAPEFHTGSRPSTMDPNYEQAWQAVLANAGDSNWLFQAIMNGLGVKECAPLAIEEVDKLLSGPAYELYLKPDIPTKFPKLIFPFLVRHILPLDE
ncbi:hypothetical protein HDE_09784 [Halotydeus destructor]|nr:hypothetical protein HDE_09784 [Halotydeus destructor]